MSVPDHSSIIHSVYASGLYDLKTHEGLAKYVDASVLALHVKDANWGHLKKKPGQTQIHGHAEDAALYKKDDGTAQAVDFIADAGGPNPKPRWGVDSFVYKHSDWLDPMLHDGQPPPQTPQYPPYPFPEDVVDGAGVALFADFAEAGQAPNPLMFRFAFRVAYSWLTKEVPDLEASKAKHRKEWRSLLGLS